MTDRRQTTDGRTTTYSEREHEFTFAKKKQNLFHVNCGLQIRQIWIQLITKCVEYSPAGVQNTHHWSGQNETATENGRGPSWIMSSLRQPFVSRVADRSRFCTLSLAIGLFLHSVINRIQIWRILRPQLRWDKCWSYFLWQLSGTTCAMSISSFTR